jgi:putative FmdB family regulatory protein
MPLYEYECESCGNRFERIQKFSDPLVEICPTCGGKVRKLISSPAIQFKGSGFYITDYAKPSESSGRSSDKGSEKSSGKGADKGADSSSEKSAGSASKDSGQTSKSSESKSSESKSSGSTDSGGKSTDSGTAAPKPPSKDS